MKYCGPNLSKFMKKNDLEHKISEKSMRSKAGHDESPLIEPEEENEDGMVPRHENASEGHKMPESDEEMDHALKGTHGAEHADDDYEEHGASKTHSLNKWMRQKGMK